jgi:hypothetical protein
MAEAGTEEDGEPMKTKNQLTRSAGLLTLALCAGVCSLWPAALGAAEAAPKKSGTAQWFFATPEEAVKTLQAAAASKDKAAMDKIFGPEYRELLTGDAVQDAQHAEHFAAAVALGCKPVPEGAAKITIEVGTNNWPMPIPLVKADGQWHFDTPAGKEEIIARHIGKDELHAIGVCRAYVTAQQQFARMNTDAGRVPTYAQRFKSRLGMKDGLYWHAADKEPASPFGPVVAEAHAEGYGGRKAATLHPFHGYYFTILTRQGEAAPGGKLDYMSHGKLTGGFALVAYPEQWDKSGIMTFIVNQDGKLYQSNLGEKTSRLAAKITEYNPDNTWTLVQDAGVVDAAAEK